MPKRKHYADEANKALPPGERHLCAFSADGQNCREPSTMTDAIICPGAGQTDTRRWLCRWHFAVKDDFEDGRHVLDDLLANRQPRAENWCDKLVHERIANSTDPLMARARLIAEGKGDDQDKHDLLRDLQKRLTGFAARTKVPDAPA